MSWLTKMVRSRFKKPVQKPVKRPVQKSGKVFDLSKKQLLSLDGFNLYIMPDDLIGFGIQSSKVHEPHVGAVIRRTLSAGDTFLDLGANIGYFSMLASPLVGKAGRVLAFEPNPQNQQLIMSSILENSDNIKLFPYAVSDTATIFKMMNGGSNGVVVSNSSKSQDFSFYAQSVILDELLKDETRIDLIKIDIEAHEPFALKGMEKLMNRLKPKIITEFHPWAMRKLNTEAPEEYLQFLFGLDYSVSIILEGGELKSVNNAEDIMEHYRALNNETAHLDLYAEPISKIHQ